MSKASRRQQRTGTASQTSTPRAPAPSSSERPPSHSPTGTARAGRRSQTRHAPGMERSFLERYRTLIVGVVVVAAVALIGGVRLRVRVRGRLHLHDDLVARRRPPARPPGRRTRPATSSPTWVAATSSTATSVTYQYCAPASGSHYNKAGSGPIQPRLYGPNDTVIPQGWIHNLEHGALVVLYTGSSEGATPDGQKQLQAFYDSFPNSPVCDIQKGTTQGPVIARFDQMATDYSAHRLGPGPAARDLRHGGHPRLLRRLGRADQPGAAVHADRPGVAEPGPSVARRAERQPSAEPSATPSASPS